MDINEKLSEQAQNLTRDQIQYYIDKLLDELSEKAKGPLSVEQKKMIL